MQESPTKDVNVVSTRHLISPVELAQELPVTPTAERTVLEGRDEIRKVLSREDSRMMMVVGPCSIHDEEAAVEYAGRLLELRRELEDRLLIVMRVYFEKPRTTVGWKGLIYDPHLDDTFDIDEGLRVARRLMGAVAEMGMYTGTEFLDPIVPQYLRRLGVLVHHRRENHREPDASPDGERPIHAGRIQERHGRFGADRR